MGVTVLTTGETSVNDGESAKITATLYDTENASLAKAAINTLTLTIQDEDGSVINSRNGTDILDANGGTLATDGTLTLKLTAADNAFQSSDKTRERHFVELAWTWDDAQSVEQTGKQTYILWVEKLGHVNG